MDHIVGDVGGAAAWAGVGALVAWLRDGHVSWLVPLGAAIAALAFLLRLRVRQRRRVGRQPVIQRDLLRQLAARPDESLNLNDYARRANVHSLHVDEAANGLAVARLVEYDYTSGVRGRGIRLTPKGNRYVVDERIV